MSDSKEGTIFVYNDRGKLQGNDNYFKQIRSDVRISYLRNISFFFNQEEKCYMVITEATDIQHHVSPGRTFGLILGLGIPTAIIVIAANSGN
jgi:hypothetical protein